MTRPLRPAHPGTVHHASAALDFLRRAHTHLSIAEAPKALEKVERAIKSAEGALRHARRRPVTKD